jgi:hypothetical protein
MVPPSVLMAAVPWLMAPASLSKLMLPVPLVVRGALSLCRLY